MGKYTKGQMSVIDAIKTLKRAMQNDPDYAWTWHCNIAVQFQDAGVSHAISNDGASRFMKLCFDVDTLQRRGVPPLLHACREKLLQQRTMKPPFNDNPPLVGPEKED